MSQSTRLYEAHRVALGKPAQSILTHADDLDRQAKQKRDRALKLLTEALQLESAAAFLRNQ